MGDKGSACFGLERGCLSAQTWPPRLDAHAGPGRLGVRAVVGRAEGRRVRVSALGRNRGGV